MEELGGERREGESSNKFTSARLRNGYILLLDYNQSIEERLEHVRWPLRSGVYMKGPRDALTTKTDDIQLIGKLRTDSGLSWCWCNLNGAFVSVRIGLNSYFLPPIS